LDPRRRGPNLLHGGQQESDEDGDDGDHDQQLDQRETALPGHVGVSRVRNWNHFFSTTVIWSGSWTGRYGRSSNTITHPRTRIVFPWKWAAGSLMPFSLNLAAASAEMATPRFFSSLKSSSESR